MDNDPLDHLLGRLARAPIPPTPPGLEDRVRRQIRQRRAVPDGGRWWQTFRNPGWETLRPAFAALAVAVVVGVVMGRGTADAFADPRGLSAGQTGRSLGLEVFSSAPPAMPSTLLNRRP